MNTEGAVVAAPRGIQKKALEFFEGHPKMYYNIGQVWMSDLKSQGWTYQQTQSALQGLYERGRLERADWKRGVYRLKEPEFQPIRDEALRLNAEAAANHAETPAVQTEGTGGVTYPNLEPTEPETTVTREAYSLYEAVGRTGSGKVVVRDEDGVLYTLVPIA